MIQINHFDSFESHIINKKD